jgi:predicted acyltransferase
MQPPTVPGGGSGAAEPEAVSVAHPDAQDLVLEEPPPAPLLAPTSEVADEPPPMAPDEPRGPAERIPPPDLSSSNTKRAFALDALRGLFLVSMTFGFTLSSDKLPVWMYHRQFPPPGDVAVNVAGISWRDLAYGSFLFTMAAALPLTLSRRLSKGENTKDIIIASFRRYGLLMMYALLVGASNTFFTGYTDTGRVLAIVGFCIMALVYTRRRPDWNERGFRILNRAGWVLAVLFVLLSPLIYGKSFSFTRIDDVITDLAVASLVGSLVWYFTRENLTPRLVFLAAVVALDLSARTDGWIQQWWYSSPVPWAFGFNQLSLMTVIIPGTICGDALLWWMRAREEGTDESVGWSRQRLRLVAALTAAFTPVVVVGLYNRYVELTTLVVVAGLLVGWVATRTPTTPVERLMRTLYGWGAIWLMIGLFLEPSEGGIRKVPETLTYFFTVTGTTSMLMVSLVALIDGLGRLRPVSWLVDFGQNPLFGYVLYTVLLNSIFELIAPLRPVLEATPAQSLIRSVVMCAIVVMLVRHLSRKRIYWRT